MGGDGLFDAQGVNQGGTCVHSHSHAKGFGDFFFGGASLERCIGVEGNATITVRGNGNGKRDELTSLFAQK